MLTDDISDVHVPGRVTLALLFLSVGFFSSGGLDCVGLKKVAMPPEDNNGVVIAVTVKNDPSVLPGYSG